MSQYKYETAKTLAREALEALHQTGKDRAFGHELLEWIHQNKADLFPLVEKSWGSFLTRMLNDPESLVVREPGSYGYRLHVADPEQSIEPEETVAIIEAQALSPGKIQRERQLYSLLVEWLEAKEFQAANTAVLKRGGAWGNPDVIGLKCFEGIGSTLHLELVSIEAKPSDLNWKRVFFEAVSHKRFADRAYFAFAYGSAEPSVAKLPEFNELREYGEKYRVGILVIFMEPTLHKALCTETSASLIPDLTLDNVRVEEVWPAMHDPVPASIRERFLRDVLEIYTLNKLLSFGR